MVPSLSFFGYLLWALLAIVLVWLFWVLLRGRKHRVTPGCPQCLYCVTGTTGNICPECGNDLSVSGIYLHGRRRIGRFYRFIIVMIFMWLLWPFYANSTQNFWAQAAWDLYGDNDELAGSSRVQYDLFPEKSRFSTILAIYPDPLTVLPSPVGGPQSVWLPPQPVRLALIHKDGSRRDYLIESTSPDQTTWETQRVATLANAKGDTFRPGPAVDGSRDEIEDVIVKRIQQDGETDIEEDRGVLLAAALANRMVGIMMDWEPPFEVPSVFVGDAGYADVRMLSNYQSDIFTVPSPRVGPYWFIISTWSLLWLFILVLVLIPGTRTDPWNPEDHPASS